MKNLTTENLRVLVIALLTMLLSACATHQSSQVIVEDRTSGSTQPNVYQQVPVNDETDRAPSQESGDSGYQQTPAQDDAPKTDAPKIRPYTPTEKASTYPSTNTAASIEPKGAVLALLEKAEIQHQQGQNQQALTSLERAQRISPRQPAVYLQLSRLLEDMGQTQKAKQFARKGLSLSTGNIQLQKAFQAILDSH